MSVADPEILLKLQGGLGNLMFQIAGLKSFGHLSGKTIGFTNFTDQANEYYNIGRTLFPTYKNTILSRIGDMDIQVQAPRKYHEEPINGYDDLGFLLDEKNVILNCYLQNHNLFLSKSFVQGLFDFSEINISEQFQQNFKEENIACLHVRRSDYTHIEHILPCQTTEYYNSAVDAIGDYDKLLIFSDDEHWCEDNLQFPRRFVVPASYDELSSLKAMTLCNKHIIANSTFSWWGAYLSESSLVTMPKTWFGPAVNPARPIDHYCANGWLII
jgi:hypothetical protein